jgi:dihydroflavonol-4-reductase
VEELPHNAPFDENRPYKTAAASAYDYSKAVGEQLLLNTGPDAPEIVVLRPSAVIGPYDFKPSELGKALLDFRRRAIPALPEGGYDFVDVRDVARSVAQALEQGRPGEVYLLTGLYYTMKQFAQAVQDVTGIPTARLVLPYPLLKLLAPPIAWWAALRGAKPLFSREAIDALKHGHPRMDHGKAARELGHRSRPPEQSIRDFYTWYDTHTSRP